MSAKFDDYSPLGFKVILDIKIVVQHFVEAPSHMCYCPLCVKHKNEIKIMTQHNIQLVENANVCMSNKSNKSRRNISN
jgi:hypothetical protein